MEGISHEACSLAGTLGLGKLIVLLRRQRHLHRRQGRWAGSPTTRPKRFEAYGWHVIRDVDGQDGDAVAAAIARRARRDDAPVADLLQDRHRLGRAEQAGHRGGARRGARRRGSRRARARPSAGPTRRSRSRRTSAPPGITARRARAPRRSGSELLRALPRGVSGAGRGARAAHARRTAARTGPRSRTQTRRGAPTAERAAGDAPVLAGGAERARPRAAGAARRLGRPHRLEQHAAQGCARHHARRTEPATICTTACANSA